MIPLFDVVGSTGATEPEQIAATVVNVGVTFALTVIVSVVVVAHWPTAGVNVYVVVAVLSNAGDQVPAIPLFDVVGNGDNTAPEQIAAIAVNVGVTAASTVIDVVAVTPGQPPAAATV